MSDDENKDIDADLDDTPAAKPRAKPAATAAKKPERRPASPRATGAAERAWAIRRARMQRMLRQFAVVVGIPTFIAILYYTLMADDEFVSESVVNIQAPANAGDSLGEGNFVANQAADITLVRQTLTSHATLEQLLDETDWRQHYQDNGDMFSRLDGDGSEEIYGYFRHKIAVSGGAGSPLRLEVRAFSGDAAAKFATAMLAIAEKRVNEIALRPLDDQLALARERLAAAQKAHGDLGPPPTPGADGAVAPSPIHAAATERLVAATDVVSLLELARAGQKRYFTIISGPTRPDEARYPERIWGIATVFVVSFALMGIFGLLFGAIREHAKV